ncbi:hypothetical protein H8356DRAFT_942332, partial [Neocallimastix lanati (nom. inval.)]
FISHNGFPYYIDNSIFVSPLYLTNVFDYCIDFLNDHSKETIIVHLKKEAIPNEIPNKLVKYIENHKEYFYIGKTIPKLGKVRKRIVVITREGYLGTKIEVGEMGDCREYDSKNKIILFVQDAYSLDGTEKWDFVHDILTNDISSKCEI